MYFGTDRTTDRPGPVSWKSLGLSVALHLGLALFFIVMGKIIFRPPEVIVPIDMTIVPPWAQQTDDPDPDPNPPPKPEPKVKPPPKPPEPEPEVKPPPKPVEAVEKVVEKKKPKEKPKEKLDLRKNAKLVKTPIKPPEPVNLRDKAVKVEPPPNMKAVGKGTAADKPLSPEEFRRLMNEGYRIGSRNQIATSEAQRCVSMIAQAIRREWDKESFRWYPGLQPLQVTLQLGAGGVVRGFRVISGSGDPDVDRTARNALTRLHSIPGLSASFLEQFPELTIEMRPVAGG